MNNNDRINISDLGTSKENKAKEYINFFLTYFIFLVYLYIMASLLKNLSGNMLSYLGASILLYVPIFIYIFCSSKKRSITAEDMGITRDKPIIVVILVIFYIGLFIYKREFTLYSFWQWMFYLLCTGVSEELMFRGYMYERSKQFMARKQAILWNCLLFAFIHVPPQIVLQGLTIRCAISYLRYSILRMSLITFIFIKIKEKTNTIWIPVILHSIANFK